MVESHSHRLGDIFWPQSSHHINWFAGFCPSSKNLLENSPPQKKYEWLRQRFKAIRFHGASCFHGLARKNVGWTNPLLLQQHPAKTCAWRPMENGPMGHGLKLFTPENERIFPLKINGWSRCIPNWNSSFLGDILGNKSVPCFRSSSSFNLDLSMDETEKILVDPEVFKKPCSQQSWHRGRSQPAANSYKAVDQLANEARPVLVGTFKWPLAFWHSVNFSIWPQGESLVKFNVFWWCLTLTPVFLVGVVSFSNDTLNPYFLNLDCYHKNSILLYLY